MTSSMSRKNLAPTAHASELDQTPRDWPACQNYSQFRQFSFHSGQEEEGRASATNQEACERRKSVWRHQTIDCYAPDELDPCAEAAGTHYGSVTDAEIDDSRGVGHYYWSQPHTSDMELKQFDEEATEDHVGGKDLDAVLWIRIHKDLKLLAESRIATRIRSQA